MNYDKMARVTHMLDDNGLQDFSLKNLRKETA